MIRGNSPGNKCVSVGSRDQSSMEKQLHHRLGGACIVIVFFLMPRVGRRRMTTRVPHDLMVDQNHNIDHEVGHVLSSP